MVKTKLWLLKSPSDTFKLSVISTRLLVTSRDIHQLIGFDADGNELTRVQQTDYIRPRHVMESPTGTFISQYNGQLEQYQVIEVNIAGKELRQFSHPLYTLHITIDCHCNTLVADCDNCQILLLDNHLSLSCLIINKHQLVSLLHGIVRTTASWVDQLPSISV